MERKKKTPADKAEAKRLKKSDAESDTIFDNDPILGDVYDDIQAMEDRKFSQYPEQRTVITGAQFIDLLFQHTEEEAELAKIGKSKIYKRNHQPFPEKISRIKFFVRDCIADWVKSKDLLTLQGDVDRDFDSCEFPPKDLFRCIGEKRILEIMRSINLVVDERLESLIQESSKPEPTQPEPEPTPKREPRTQKPTALASESNSDANVFRKDGDVWKIAFNQKELPAISHVVGFDYIQRALVKPGEIIPNWRIEGLNNKPDSSNIDNSPQIPADIEGRRPVVENSNKKMDRKTYESVSKSKNDKIEELEKQIREGQSDTRELEGEIEKLEQYLNQNTYQGRIKEFSNDDVRASNRIRRAIKTATNKISKHNQSLAKLLKDSIKTTPTGTRYTPTPGIASWEL